VLDTVAVFDVTLPVDDELEGEDMMVAVDWLTWVGLGRSKPSTAAPIIRTATSDTSSLALTIPEALPFEVRTLASIKVFPRLLG
jgi:hypothetical protein